VIIVIVVAEETQQDTAENTKKELVKIKRVEKARENQIDDRCRFTIIYKLFYKLFYELFCFTIINYFYYYYLKSPNFLD
jgi:hypothetical protein